MDSANFEVNPFVVPKEYVSLAINPDYQWSAEDLFEWECVENVWHTLKWKPYNHGKHEVAWGGTFLYWSSFIVKSFKTAKRLWLGGLILE